MNPPSNKTKRENKERKQREKTKRENIFQNILITWKKNFYAVIFENSPNYFQFIL